MKIIQFCRFNTFEQLEPLKDMKISELDCFGSEVATLEKYRYVENQIEKMMKLNGTICQRPKVM